MSKGLGKPAKRMLFRLYDKGKTLDELGVTGRCNKKHRRTNYYVLQRLIQQGLVWKQPDHDIDTYYLTQEGKEISSKLHQEFLGMITEYLDILCMKTGIKSIGKPEKIYSNT